jgi:hypothetical protein
MYMQNISAAEDAYNDVQLVGLIEPIHSADAANRLEGNTA